MLFWKILMLSSDLPSLKHCIFHLTPLCHGAHLFHQHWTSGEPLLAQDLTKNVMANWPRLWSADWLCLAYEAPQQEWYSADVLQLETTSRRHVLPVTVSFCSHTSSQEQAHSVKFPSKETHSTPRPSTPLCHPACDQCEDWQALDWKLISFKMFKHSFKSL